MAEIEIEVADHVKKSDAIGYTGGGAGSITQGGEAGNLPSCSVRGGRPYRPALGEERLKIAEFALDELVAEQNEAQAALDKATEALHAAARAVLAQEGHALVAKIDKLEGESLRTPWLSSPWRGLASSGGGEKSVSMTPRWKFCARTRCCPWESVTMDSGTIATPELSWFASASQP